MTAYERLAAELGIEVEELKAAMLDVGFRPVDAGKRERSRRARRRADPEKRRTAEAAYQHNWSRHNSLERLAALKRIRDLVKRGKLVRPRLCQECGKDPGLSANGTSLIYAHLPDIDDLDTLEWLCSLCAGKRRWRHAP